MAERLAVCPQIPASVRQQSSLRPRGRETSLGMSGGAGWPGAHVCEAHRDHWELLLLDS